MPTARLVKDSILDPISTELPAGTDLRWTAEWDRIKEARRADDTLQAGKWAKKEPKSADWRLVEELATSMLQTLSKDLQLGLWLTEASLQLRGFAGLRDGLWVTRELLARYWDEGLHPVIEEGPQDREGPIRWMNEKLVDSILGIPITGAGSEAKYNVLDVRDARRVGTEAGCIDDSGNVDPKKRKAYEAAIAAGRPSMEMLARAIRETKRAAYEELCADFQAAQEEFTAFKKVVDAKFGDVGPALSNVRSALHEIEQELNRNLDQKRKDEPNLVPSTAARDGQSTPVNGGSAFVVNWQPSGDLGSGGGDWRQAEELIRSGQVDRGLAEMTRLAAAETSGRSRFHRKLLLAEVCLGTQRDRLARAILEELAGQIDKYQLESWEASDLIARVWTRLYGLYKRGNPSDPDRASQLYERICRLDPWQALACAE